MLKICFTFDYELFFGKNNGTNAEILFEPTDKLIEMLSEEQVTATFFADTCSIEQHMKYGKLDYVNDFVAQIQKMCIMNQDVQLHIHSHWLKSEFVEGEWKYNGESYRLHSFGFNKDSDESVYGIIRRGKEFLESTLRSVKEDYKCIAYRAGGFTLQPHQELVKVLNDNGIRIDSSVAPMLYSEGVNSYDYVKKDLHENWYISAENEWWENSKSENALLEIPVATENKNPLWFLVKRVLAPNTIKLNLGPKRGSYMNEQAIPRRKVSYWKYLTCYNAMSLDAYCAEYIYSQLRRYYRKHKCNKKNCVIAIIGHPKLVTDKYVENTRRLIEFIKKDNRFELIGMPRVFDQLMEESK